MRDFLHKIFSRQPIDKLPESLQASEQSEANLHAVRLLRQKYQESLDLLNTDLDKAQGKNE